MPKVTLDKSTRKTWELQRYILGELSKQGITQTDLAAEIGSTQQRVSYLLKKADDLPLSFVAKTFKALNVSDTDKAKLLTI